MTTVMCFGSFDVLHPGHLYYLKESRQYGDKLIVVVSTDKNFKKIKGKEPKYDEHERLEHIRELSYVDRAVLGSENDFLEVVEEYNPDIICLGYDQETIGKEKLQEEIKKRKLNIDIFRMNPYREDMYKSSKLRD